MRFTRSGPSTIIIYSALILNLTSVVYNSSVTVASRPPNTMPNLEFYPYLIVPFALIFYGFDTYFNHSQLQSKLPSDPHNLVWFAAIFHLPHIFASILIFADKEYCVHYRSYLLPCIALLLLPFVLKGDLYDIYFFAVIIWTAKHVFSQQAGLALRSSEKNECFFKGWKFLGNILGVAQFFVILFPHLEYYRSIQIVTIVVTIVFALYSTVLIILKKTSLLLKAWTTAVLVTSYFGLMEVGFWAILIPRMIHDLTAFIFYTKHNENRNALNSKNIQYKFLKPLLGNFSFVITFLSAALFALPFTINLYSSSIIYNLVLGIASIHYFTDAKVWRKGTLHNGYV